MRAAILRRRGRVVASGAFDFGTISGLVADYDPNSLAGANGSNATPFPNKSGLSASLDLLSNAGDEFTIQTPGGAVSGKVIRGQGAGANGGKSGLYTSGAVAGSALSSAGEVSVCALVKFANATDQDYIFRWDGSGGSQVRLFLDGAGNMVFRHGVGGDEVLQPFSDAASWHVIVGRYVAADSATYLQIDAAAGNDFVGMPIGAAETGTEFVGCRNSGNVFGLQGDMRRLLVYNRGLTDLQAATVVTQLGLLAGLSL